MTREEVKIGLRSCADEECGKCPYRHTKRGCVDVMIRDAHQTIRELEAEINAQAANGVREEGTEGEEE